MINSKVVLSGITGFVGSNLAQSLKLNGYHVSGISRESRSSDVVGWEDFYSRGTDANVWIHLAGKAHDLRGSSNSVSYDLTNFNLTTRFFDAFCESEGNTFIFLSSVKAVADRVTGILLETDLEDPKTPYGISKLKAEKYILNNLPSGKRVFILRPCMIHGPGNKGNLNLLYKVIQNGLPWLLGAFENKRSFLSVDNLCFVVNEILIGNLLPGIYIVADTEPVSTNDLIRIIASEGNNKPNLWIIPKAVVRIFAKLGDLFRLPFNTERLYKLTDNYVVSNQKLLQALGKPLPVTAHEGLRKTIKSFT